MPGLYSLARAGVCSVAEARDMPVELIFRLFRLLSDENERRAEAARSAGGRISASRR